MVSFADIQYCIFVDIAGLLQAGRREGGELGPVSGQTVNPIPTRGIDYAHHSTTISRIYRPCEGPA